ncbi:hypothetical protein [Saccharicrinis aurantiacus]|uniref:hypothetical protein n=1 Tax=Saccharicrinis aurantiacus TaxID=1849719 RepID=UPI0024935AB3|nr:hypothetical protein [Saccharicrinis aurantiacus]
MQNRLDLIYSKMKILNLFFVFLLSVIIVYLITYIDKIGLHGDEAAIGLYGVDILENGIAQPYGLNYYTGILQALLDSVLFRIWKIDVFSLRIGGVFFNILSLFVVTKVLTIRVSRRAAIVFLLLFAQSVFLLCYSKIAWEVCSFNFVLISILLYSIHKLEEICSRERFLYLFIFLSVSILGSYNHIIFSSVVLALVVSIITYLLIEKVSISQFILNCISLAFISLFNIICAFIVMTLYIDVLWSNLGVVVFIAPGVLIIIELLFFDRTKSLVEIILRYLYKFSFSKIVFKPFLIGVVFISFIKYHSLKLFDVFQNEVVLLRLFSYEVPVFFNLYFMAAAIVIFGFIIYELIIDFSKKKTPIFSYFIVVYIGVVCLYTRGFSIRYYHILTFLLFLFFSVKIVSVKMVLQKKVMSIVLINVIFVQYIIWNINLNENRQVEAKWIKIGRNSIETSAHFLSFVPIIDYVKEHRIGILHSEDMFFIGNVFDFYKNVYPEIKGYNNTAIVNYDYEVIDSGFVIE